MQYCLLNSWPMEKMRVARNPVEICMINDPLDIKSGSLALAPSITGSGDYLASRLSSTCIMRKPPIWKKINKTNDNHP